MADPTRTALDKTVLRRSMREQRRAMSDRPERSLTIWEHVRSVPAVASASRVLVFTSVPGEPETEPFVEWCRASGKEVAMPEDEVDAAWPDVVIVPGVAFTVNGDRLGQGGGWYDRFLAAIGPGCTTIGVGFDIQLVERLPVEPHDVRLDHVVTESGMASRSPPSAR
jgi:5-formyltetrahydrofolate cyclo-ligase